MLLKIIWAKLRGSKLEPLIIRLSNAREPPLGKFGILTITIIRSVWLFTKHCVATALSGHGGANFKVFNFKAFKQKLTFRKHRLQYFRLQKQPDLRNWAICWNQIKTSKPYAGVPYSRCLSIKKPFANSCQQTILEKQKPGGLVRTSNLESNPQPF